MFWTIVGALLFVFVALPVIVFLLLRLFLYCTEEWNPKWTDILIAICLISF